MVARDWSVALGVGIVGWKQWHGFCCLFCQAEDGIRGLVRSRGLGDVYKRQLQQRARRQARLMAAVRTLEQKAVALGPDPRAVAAVSYTHLTLPTTYPV